MCGQWAFDYQMTAYLLRMRSGKQGGGKGALVQTERSGTLATSNDQTLFVIALAGNTIGRKPMNGGNGNGFEEDGKMYTLTATDVHGVCYENHAQDARYSEKTTCPTITSRYGTGGGNVPLALTVHQNQRNEVRLMTEMPALTTGGGKPGQGNPVIFENQSQVRRLTPTECERLMGFPDGYTNIKENCPDSPRYKALGNSWAVPVVRWIGKRIDAALRGDAVNDEVLKKEA